MTAIATMYAVVVTAIFVEAAAVGPAGEEVTWRAGRTSKRMRKSRCSMTPAAGRSFLDQIGLVPGMATSVKATLGPVSLVGEWNGAINRATLVDDSGTFVNIRPSAWQLSLGYQFDWNPWVEAIGAQGTYVTIGYSESRDLAGVLRAGDRVGFVPRRRFLVNVGEWVLDGVKFAVEYSHIKDYSKSEGGTGNSANGFFSTLTYAW